MPDTSLSAPTLKPPPPLSVRAPGAARRLTAKYLLALGLLAALALATYVWTHRAAGAASGHAAAIEVSSQQRALSQRIALAATQLVAAPDAAAAHQALQGAVNQMARGHSGLTRGDPALRLPAPRSPALHRLYFDGPRSLDRQVHEYLAHARAVLAAPASARTAGNPDLLAIQQAAFGDLALALDSAVRQYRLEHATELARLQGVQGAALALTLLALGLKGWLIFRPMVRQASAGLAALEAQYQAADRARSESRAILDASSEAMVLAGSDGRFLSVNRRFGELFGVPAEHMLGRCFEYLTEELGHIFAEPAALRARLAGTARDEERTFTELMAMRWPHPRELSLFSAPVHMGNQHYLGRLYVFRDVTHERAVDRMKSEFVTMVSHELRTPLTSIKGYVDMLLDGDAGPMSDPHQELLGIVKANTGRLLALINDLLDLSRIEAGRLALDRVPLDVAPLIRQVASTLRPHLMAKRQQLVLDLPVPPAGEASAKVLGDPARIIQILTNLVSKAVKYTPPGGTISVQLRAEGAMQSIAVRDTGAGLTVEDQERLFTRFFRANNRATHEAGGTGLGLAITRSLVELHEGRITVESQPGHGSTFRVTLPLAASEHAIEGVPGMGDMSQTGQSHLR